MNAQKRKQQISVTTAALAVVTLLVYAFTVETAAPVVFLQVAGCAAVPAALLISERFTHYPLSVVLFAAVAVHVVLSGYLGSALGFYYRIAWWDLFLHGMFGVLATAVLHDVLRRHTQTLGTLLTASLIFLAVMGLAALWEVLEYVTDLVAGGDAQRVRLALQTGASPVGDTMTDIIITAVGAFAYAAVQYLVKRIKK